MFGDTFSLKLTRNEAGVPTGVTGVTKENPLAGAVKHVVSHASNDDVVVGAGRTLGTAAVAYASAQVAAKMKDGEFALNPWKS